MQTSRLLDIDKSTKGFEGYALVKNAWDATSSNGSPYFNITLTQKTKTMDCKLWENKFAGKSIEELKALFVPGKMVYVKGSVSEFRGNLQMAITNFRKAEETEVNIGEFIETAPESLEDLQNEYEAFLAEIHHPVIRTICADLYEENKQRFLNFPAATSLHHSFVGGLLYHTVSMLRLGKSIASQYPKVDKDILYAGIALHDLGKVVELSDAVAPQYTLTGNFLGHITIVAILIDRKLQELKAQGEITKEDAQKVIELQHVVLAHHGKLEYGSPVLAHTLEAEIIHQIDMMDSRINMIIHGLHDKQEGEIHKIHPIGNYYKPFSS